MAQRQFRSDDTSPWFEGFGSGGDGTLTISSNTTDTPIDSACTGTLGAITLSATNVNFTAGQVIVIHQTTGSGAGTWELNKVASYTAGTITLAYPLANNYVSGAQVLVMEQHLNVTVDTGFTLTAKAWNGTVGGILALQASNAITINGSVSGAGKGFGGGATAPSAAGVQGTSSNGAGTNSTSNNGAGGGGGALGDGAAAGAGAGGGNGGSGTNGQAGGRTGGTGGTTVGSADLITMLFGGGGGGGGTRTGTSSTGGTGGTSGGIVLLFAPTITMGGSSSVNNNGNAGSAKSGTGSSAGGGGASGGSILIKCHTATLGSSLITASGGAGGAGNSGSSNDGGAGGAGRIHIDYLTSYTGTTTPTIDARQDLTLFRRFFGAMWYHLI